MSDENDVVEDRSAGSGRTALNLFLNRIGPIPVLTSEQEIELAARIKQGDEAALETMVTSNLKLVVAIAKGYGKWRMDLMDMISEGSIGLLIAAKRFDPVHGCKFSTYASIWIHQKIKRALTEQSSDIRIPVYQYDKIKHLKDAEDRLEIELGRPPTDDELGDALGRSPQSLGLTRDAANARLYAEDLPHEERDEDLISWLPAPELVSDDHLLNQFHYLPLAALIKQLTPRDRLILTMRFGLNGSSPKILEDVAAVLGITRERCRQLEQKALRRLKELIQFEAMKDGVDLDRKAILSIVSKNQVDESAPMA